MICPLCAEAADQTASIIARNPGFGPNAHHPDLCRDAAIQPHGCTCQHGTTRSSFQPNGAQR